MSSLGKQRQAGLVFILITLFIDILGIGIVIPILPELITELAGNDTTLAGIYLGAIGTTYALMQFCCAPILGMLSDRFGRRPVLLASLFGLGLDFLIQGLAPSIAWLFVGRAVAGVMGASITTANAYIADVSTPATRARNYGMVGAMFGLGFIFGPVLGGILGEIHLRLPFFISAGLALANWLYGFWILPESLPAERRGRLTRYHINPLGGKSHLRAYPLVEGLAITFFFSSLANRGLENVWVLYTSYRFGWGKLTNGLVLGAFGAMAAIVQGLLGRRIIARLGKRRTVIMGLAISSIAFLGYGLANRGWMVLGIIAFGAFGGLTGPAIQTIIAGEVDSSEQGRVQGALTSLMSLTSVLAPTLFTSILFSYYTSQHVAVKIPGIPFFVGSGLLLIALALVRRVFRKIPDR